MISLEEQRQVIEDLTNIMGADIKRMYAALTTSLVGEQLSSLGTEKREGLEADLANQIIYFEVLKNYIGVDEKLLNRELLSAFSDFKQYIDSIYKADGAEEPVIGSSIIGADPVGGKEPTLSDSLKELEKVTTATTSGTIKGLAGLPKEDNRDSEESKPIAPYTIETLMGENGEEIKLAGETFEDLAKKASELAENTDPDQPLETDNYPEINPPS